MTSYINRSLVEGIEVIFENCEVIYIPEKYIETIDVRYVKKWLYLSGSEGEIGELIVSKYVNLTVHEYGDTEEILQIGMLFADEYDPYDGYARLKRSKDITGIGFVYKDGTSETISVDYSMDDNYYDPNQYQVVTPLITKEVPRGVNIIIARPDTLAKINR